MSDSVKAIDPTAIELRRYNDGGRTVVVAGGKEYGPPQYEHDIHHLRRNAILGDGMPVYCEIVVRDTQSGEPVVVFGTRMQ